MSTETTVPIGPTTLAGWGTAVAAFASAVIVYFTGGHDAQSVTAVELAGAGLLSGGLTQVGRYLQAHKQIGTVVTHVDQVINEASHDPFVKTLVTDVENEIPTGIKKDITNELHTVENIGKKVIADVENEDPVAITGLDVSTSTVAPQDNSNLALPPVNVTVDAANETTTITPAQTSAESSSPTPIPTVQ